MTNREKYITKRDEYDLMIQIWRRSLGQCPIEVVGAEKPKCVPDTDYIHSDCQTCIQNWLNEEADQPRPQWQDAMMKNFLRR